MRLTKSMANSLVSKKQRFYTHFSRHQLMFLVLCIILLILCVIASIVFGSRSVGMHDLVNGLLHPGIDTFENNVIQKRISRTIFSLFCGAALGVSGALMHAV